MFQSPFSRVRSLGGVLGRLAVGLQLTQCMAQMTADELWAIMGKYLSISTQPRCSLPRPGQSEIRTRSLCGTVSALRRRSRTAVRGKPRVRQGNLARLVLARLQGYTGAAPASPTRRCWLGGWVAGRLSRLSGAVAAPLTVSVLDTAHRPISAVLVQLLELRRLLQNCNLIQCYSTHNHISTSNFAGQELETWPMPHPGTYSLAGSGQSGAGRRRCWRQH